MESNLSIITKQLYLSDDKQYLLLTALPLQEQINANELVKIISGTDFSSFKISPVGIKKAIESFHKLANNSETKLDPISVAERIDAQLEIAIDPRQLSATAKITSAYAGQPITLDQITQALTKLKINNGISKKTLHLLIQKSKQAKPGAIYQAVVAKGTPPVNDKSATLKRLVETPDERKMIPKLKENGRVDMRDLGQLVTVKPGTPLMRKIPFQEGTPGVTVTSKIIKQKKGVDVALHIGENTELDPENENLLIATIAGVPKTISNGMMVDNALIIENVDIGFGHINYDGDIFVANNICDGMKVKASGNITVAGFIESANVECDGDLFVGKGILGHKRAADGSLYSSEIKCQGSVTATFSQYTKMDIQKNLHIKNQLLHCMIHCQGHINVQNDSGNKGIILGGELYASHGVSTVILGSPAGTKTLINLTGPYQKLIKIKEELIKEQLQEQNKINDVFIVQQKLTTIPPSEKKKAIVVRLDKNLEDAKNKLAILNTQIEKNSGELSEYFNVSNVIASKKIHNQISIAIGQDILLTQREYGPTRITFKENELIAEPYLP